MQSPGFIVFVRTSRREQLYLTCPSACGLHLSMSTVYQNRLGSVLQERNVSSISRRGAAAARTSTVVERKVLPPIPFTDSVRSPVGLADAGGPAATGMAMRPSWSRQVPLGSAMAAAQAP